MIYFISDAHLGCRMMAEPAKHEKRLVDWLDMVKADASSIYMLGDMFDFWFEYSTVVPKGFVRFFGKMAELVDSGIEINFFTGNHDIWTFGYLESEIGLKVYRKPQIVTLNDKIFYLAHGDEIYSATKKFGLLRKIFHNPTAQGIFAALPCSWGQKAGYAWSKNNRIKHLASEIFQGEENEKQIIFAKELARKNPEIQFFIFGHRHVDLDFQLDEQKHIVLLGDFIKRFSYGSFDGEKFTLKYF
ncbi:MAG: UDP-2,3-diacylglucosamine diphosphatase [Paludibacter sp.]|jgi:UDP-2,3-diacylglucosamine hydrolase|nr:UDP-2,3-diacylglucosamine diphosphatase [Paludibacter sp.]